MADSKFLKNKKLIRRDFLIGAGTVIALPFLESLYANQLYAQNSSPLRVLFGHIGPGIYQNSRAGYALSSTIIQPLSVVNSHTTIFRGVRNNTTAKHPNTVPNFTHGGSGTSFDIHAGKITGQGSFGGPVSIATNPLSLTDNRWKISNQNNQAITPLNNLNTILSSVVAANTVAPGNPGAPVVDKYTRMKTSALDYVIESIKSIKTKLNSSDKIILDRHLSLVEEAEKLNNTSANDTTSVTTKSCNVPNVNNNVDLQKRFDLLADIITMGFTCDTRRVFSASMGSFLKNPGYEVVPSYKALIDKIKSRGGVFKNVANAGDKDQRKLNPGYHPFTHNYEKNVKDKSGKSIVTSAEVIKVMTDLSQFHVSFFARLANNLKNTQDTNGASVLDNSLIYVGADMGDPTVHGLDHTFTAVIGKAGGKIKHGKGTINLNKKPVTAFQNALLDAIGSTDKNKYSNKNGEKGQVNKSIFT